MMIAFVIEHDVCITETGKRIVEDLRVRIHRLKTIKPLFDISVPPDPLGFIQPPESKAAASLPPG
ncbi:MAG: hypothetical protein LBQ38_12995 [Spirochaetaceae bacterium]|jgi:hypothetical protein|nr:hypothetical protein [Spirochaetaceae bacterium]